MSVCVGLMIPQVVVPELSLHNYYQTNIRALHRRDSGDVGNTARSTRYRKVRHKVLYRGDLSAASDLDSVLQRLPVQMRQCPNYGIPGQ
jgi:hypothetical protein